MTTEETAGSFPQQTQQFRCNLTRMN